MVNRNERYWKNKGERAAAAKNHLAYVSEKYKEEISEQVVNTVMYDARVMQRSDKSGKPRQFFLSADTVTAIFTAKRSKDTGKVAALNFASFKNPGGMFLAGSKAQEECLCMDSTLYPVLNSFRGTYYEPNKKLLNRSLYTDRALYTPDVVFENEECTVKADIITCAAPKNMQGQPVWCPDLNSYGIIKCDTSGKWKGIPYIHGSQYFPEFGTSTDFEYNILERGLVCQHIL